MTWPLLEPDEMVLVVEPLIVEVEYDAEEVVEAAALDPVVLSELDDTTDPEGVVGGALETVLVGDDVVWGDADVVVEP